MYNKCVSKGSVSLEDYNKIARFPVSSASFISKLFFMLEGDLLGARKRSVYLPVGNHLIKSCDGQRTLLPKS